MRKIKLLGLISAFLLVVAQSGATPACWLNWYQPKLPE
ncbi:MAG: cyclic lactone autoinducer peptide [Syntrophomonadaceae bacterium]